MCESPLEVMPGVASFPGGGVPQVHHLARTLGCKLQATCRVMSTCWSETTFRGKVISLSFKASQAFMNVLPLWWIRSNSAKVRHLSPFFSGAMYTRMALCDLIVLRLLLPTMCQLKHLHVSVSRSPSWSIAVAFYSGLSSLFGSWPALLSSLLDLYV